MIAETLTIAQGILGGIQAISGESNAKRLFGQRKAFKTTEEAFKALNLTKSLASTGFDAGTLSYLTGNIDRSFAESAGIAKRMGGDANSLSAMLDQRIQGIMKVGAENHALNMRNMGAYLGELRNMGASKTMEWRSEQDLIKDQQQKAAQDKQDGIKNITSAANAFIGIDSANQMEKLYADRTDAMFSAGNSFVSNSGMGRPSNTPAVTIPRTQVGTPSGNISQRYNWPILPLYDSVYGAYDRPSSSSPTPYVR